MQKKAKYLYLWIILKLNYLCLLFLSKDEKLEYAFKNNIDLHDQSVFELFSVLDQKTRANAKALNFALIYGMTSYGLAKKLDITIKEEITENYFNKFPSIKKYIDDINNNTKKYSYTIYKRRRKITDNKNILNSMIQGSAADIVKKAMIRIFKRLSTLKQADILLQIHDELIIQCFLKDKNKVLSILKNNMTFYPIKNKIRYKIKISRYL